jgi:hypothetical protein
VILAGLSGCSQPVRVVERAVPVEVPGPVRWREIPPELGACGERPAELRDGMTGGQLVRAARGWQARAECLEGDLEAIRRLGASGD